MHNIVMNDQRLSDAPRPDTAKPVQGFYGWRVVAVAFVIAVFGWGVGFYGPPVYLEAVRQSRGWPIATVSGAVTLHFLVGVLVIANLPALHRRFGIAAITIAGSVLLALGVLGWSLARSPWQLYAATFLSGAGWPAMGAAAINAIVAPWFVAKRPKALSMAYNGSSVGGVIFSPIWALLIASAGFPAAAAIVGVCMVIIVAVVALTVLKQTPESVGQPPDGEEGLAAPSTAAPVAGVERLAGDKAFLTLCLGMALALFAQIGLIAQLFSLLVPALGASGAGFAAGLATAAAILGRSLVGWFMPGNADRRRVAALSLLVQTLGCVALFCAGGSNVAILLAGVMLIGLGIGNATSLPPLIAQVEFARADAPRVVALIVAIAQGAYAFAPAVFGIVRQTAPETALYCCAGAIQIAAAAVYLSGRQGYMRRVTTV